MDGKLRKSITNKRLGEGKGMRVVWIVPYITSRLTIGDKWCMDMLNRIKYGVCLFFSSRRRHTRFDCDWSSDVCSSDLSPGRDPGGLVVQLLHHEDRLPVGGDDVHVQGAHRLPDQERGLRVRAVDLHQGIRSEERRVGKECRSRWAPNH